MAISNLDLGDPGPRVGSGLNSPWWENMKSHLKQNCLVTFGGYFAIILLVNDENDN